MTHESPWVTYESPPMSHHDPIAVLSSFQPSRSQSRDSDHIVSRGSARPEPREPREPRQPRRPTSSAAGRPRAREERKDTWASPRSVKEMKGFGTCSWTCFGTCLTGPRVRKDKRWSGPILVVLNAIEYGWLDDDQVLLLLPSVGCNSDKANISLTSLM